MKNLTVYLTIILVLVTLLVYTVIIFYRGDKIKDLQEQVEMQFHYTMS